MGRGRDFMYLGFTICSTVESDLNDNLSDAIMMEQQKHHLQNILTKSGFIITLYAWQIWHVYSLFKDLLRCSLLTISLLQFCISKNNCSLLVSRPSYLQDSKAKLEQCKLPVFLYNPSKKCHNRPEYQTAS